MLEEDRALSENIINHTYIEEMYNLYVIFCENSKFTMVPADFLSFFEQIHQKKSITFDRDYWKQLFMNIDNDKDGQISFQDFVRFLYFQLKILFSEIDKTSIVRVNPIVSEKEKIDFHNIINCLFFERDVTNRFQIVEAIKNIQPPINLCIDLYDKSGRIKIVDSNVKKDCLIRTLETPSNFLIEILALLNSDTIDNVVSGVTTLNKFLYPFLLISSHFEVIDTFVPILNLLKMLSNTGIIERLLIFFSHENSIESMIQLKILKIFRKILNVSYFLIELQNFRKINDFLYSRSLDDDINGLVSLVDNIIKISLLKLPNYYLTNKSELRDAAFNFAVLIAKRSSINFQYIMCDHDLLSFIAKHVSIIANTDLTDFSIIELRKLIQLSAKITFLLLSLRENDFTSYSPVLQKLFSICTILKGLFLMKNNDLNFQMYYIILVSLVGRKVLLQESSIIEKAQEIVTIYFSNVSKNHIIRIYFYFIKNLLLSKYESECLKLIADTKALEFMYSIIETYKSEEQFLSEFIDVVTICINEHQKTLLSSGISKVILTICEKILRFGTFQAKNEICRIILVITEIPETIHHLLILDTDILNLIFSTWVNNSFHHIESYFFELYCVSKPNFYYTPLKNSMNLAKNLLNSELFNFSYNLKFLKKFFTVKNLDRLFTLFSSLSQVWDYTHKQSEHTDEVLIFSKYQDSEPENNILLIIYDIFLKCFTLYERSLTNLKDTQTDTCLSYLSIKIRTMKEILTLIFKDEGTLSQEEYQLTVITQDPSEIKKNCCRKFIFSENDSIYQKVVRKIQQSYQRNIALYFNDGKEKPNLIKDEADYTDSLYKVIYNSQGTKNYVLNFFVDTEIANEVKEANVLVRCFYCGIFNSVPVNQIQGMDKVICLPCMNKITAIKNKGIR